MKSCLIFSACGESASPQRRTSSGKKITEKETNASTEKAPSESSETLFDSAEGLEYKGLDFLPHIITPLPDNPLMVAIEAGYLDIRQEKIRQAGGIKDYRANTIGLYGGQKLDSLSLGFDCFEMRALSTPNSLSDVNLSGFYKGKLKDSKDTITAYNDEDDRTKFDPSAPLNVAAKISGKTIKIENVGLPPRGSISFSKAIYTFFGTHSSIENINVSLSNSKQDLVITEETGNASIDAVAVNFFGLKNIRCVFKPGESATLTNEQYSKIIPLRAITVTYNSIDISEQFGVTVLRTTYGGIGLEELSVSK